MTRRVFFYVQHLLGIGHLRRAATLARALAAAGFDVLLVSGGAPVDGLDLAGVRFHQLPPLKAADETLRDLARVDGLPFDDAFRGHRATLLVDLLRAEAPDIVLTEQFPFGRTRLRFELLPMLEAAKMLPSRPRVFASIRDVLRDTVSAARVAETLEIFDSCFDGVFIHADPRLVSLDASFAGWAQLADRAHYTGYLLDRPPPAAGPVDAGAGAGEVVVSVGGGAVGAPLLEAALAARAASTLRDRPWRLLLGGNLDGPVADRLRRAAGNGIVVEPARRDFTALLANASLSISQAGYNTVVETLACASRAVLVPFATPRETEQRRRAENLARRGMVEMVAPEELGGAALAAAVDRAMAGPSLRSHPPCDVSGGATTAALLGKGP